MYEGLELRLSSGDSGTLSRCARRGTKFEAEFLLNSGLRALHIFSGF